MKVTVILFMVVFIFWGYVVPCQAQKTVEILVVLNPEAVLRPIPRGVISLHRIPGSRIVRMDVSKDCIEEVIRELKEQKGVQSVERSRTGRFESSPGLEGLEDSDWYKEIDGEEIERLSPGTGVVVAVIDTGIDLQDSEFSSRAFVNSGEIAGDVIDNDGNGYVDDWRGWDMGDDDNDPQDENGHGTEVTSVILSLAPDCRVLPIKINQGASDTFSTADLVEGIYYAISLGARVINLSLTVDKDSEAVSLAIRAAYDAGAIVVGAAGNDPGLVEFPGSMDEVIAVGGLYGDSPAWFSPHGPEMELMAPGVAIQLISLGGVEVHASGTSFSCAMVSGTAVDLLGMNPHLKNATVRSLLDSGARDLGDPGRDDIYGEGALDGRILFNVSAPHITLPSRPFYIFSRDIPISVSIHIPPTDTPSAVYIGVLSPDNTLWWLDGSGNWHDSDQDPLSPIAWLKPPSESIDGVLFGKNGVFEAFNPAGLPSGFYQWGIAMTDEEQRLLGPVTWAYMLLF